MYSIFIHPWVVLLLNLPRQCYKTIRISQLPHIIEKLSFAHIFHEGVDTAATGAVSDDEDVLEACWLNVVFPHIRRMLLHSLALRDVFAGARITTLVWVQDNSGISILFCPVKLRELTAKFQIVIHAHASCPYTSSHRTCSLDQNQRCLICVVLRLIFELWGHEDVADWTISSLWNPKLL